MELTQPEIIQILRRRVEMNQGTLGAKAFDTSFESGRTKIKNIELGKQAPTESDLIKMARVLGVSTEDLKPREKSPEPTGRRSAIESEGMALHEKTLTLAPELGPYMDMLNKAVRLEDRELIQHIAEKLAEIFSHISAMDTQKRRAEHSA